MSDKREASDDVWGVANDVPERWSTAVDEFGARHQHLEEEFRLLDELAAPMSEEDRATFNAAVQRRNPFFRLKADSERDEKA